MCSSPLFRKPIMCALSGVDVIMPVGSGAFLRIDFDAKPNWLRYVSSSFITVLWITESRFQGFDSEPGNPDCLFSAWCHLPKARWGGMFFKSHKNSN